jgi:hypothetical protein
MNKLIIALIITIGFSSLAFAGADGDCGPTPTITPGCTVLSNCPYVINCNNPGHPTSNRVRQGIAATDQGGWFYHNDPTERNYGMFTVNCNHLDLQGQVWNDALR